MKGAGAEAPSREEASGCGRLGREERGRGAAASRAPFGDKKLLWKQNDPSDATLNAPSAAAGKLYVCLFHHDFLRNEKVGLACDQVPLFCKMPPLGKRGKVGQAGSPQ